MSVFLKWQIVALLVFASCISQASELAEREAIGVEIEQLRESGRLAVTGDLQSGARIDVSVYGGELEGAVRRFQERRGLDAGQ